MCVYVIRTKFNFDFKLAFVLKKISRKKNGQNSGPRSFKNN